MSVCSALYMQFIYASGWKHCDQSMFCSVVIETIVIIVVGEHTVTAQTNACYERLCQHTVPPGYHWYSARFCNVTIMVTGRMPRSGKLPVLDLLTGRKSGFSPTGATRCTNSGQALQDRRQPGSASLCIISRQSLHMGGNASPKISEIATVWYTLAPQGRLPWPMSKIFTAFIRLTILR